MPTNLDDLLRQTGAQWRDRVDAMPQRIPRPGLSKTRVTPWWRRRWVVVAAAAACLVALIVPIYRSADPVPIAGGAGAGADEGGACAAPYLSIVGHSRDPWWTGRRHDPEPVPTLRPGQTITLKGFAYVRGCYELDPTRTPSPMTVTVYLRGHGDRRPLAKATGTAGEGKFTTTVHIPQDFPAGTATLQAGPDWPWSTIKVTIAKQSTATASMSATSGSVRNTNF